MTCEKCSKGKAEKKLQRILKAMAVNSATRSFASSARKAMQTISKKKES